MLTMLVAYDADGNIIATLDHLVGEIMDDVTLLPEDSVVGLVDFEAHELAGGEMTDIWNADNATGSKTWPEWLGSRAHDFRVELVGPAGNKRIGALVHKVSGHRRERAAVDTAIAERVTKAEGAPADIRDLVGGPDRPLILDEQGRTLPRRVIERSTLPLLRT